VADGWDALVGAARAEAPGPVHLELGARPAVPAPLGVAGPEAGDDPAQLLDRIAAARRPLLIVGSLALRRDWGARLAALRVPVFTTCAAKGALDESGPWSAGVYTGDGKALSPEASLFRDADLVVGIGLRNTEILSPRAFAAPYLSVDEVGGDLAEGLAPALRVADADAVYCGRVLDALAGAEWGADQVVHALESMRTALDDGSWLPAACFARLNGLGFDYAAVMDTGSFCTIGEHLWLARPTRPYLGSSNGRFMGTGLPTAIGAAAGAPGTPVICATGDGGVRMYLPELKLAVAERLPVCVVLMSDGRYGSIACAPQPRVMSTRAVEIDGPSWWRTVESMGCAALPVGSPDALGAALESWDRAGPLFLEASFAPEPYAAMTNGLR
jgi:acetolactate synthase-1/2/3 large subunit